MAGDLHIRTIREDEWPEVADIQAASFHTPLSLGLLNAVAYNSFRAEVRSALSLKIKYSTPGSFCCLVAQNAKGEVIGVVEVTLQQDKDVIKRMGIQVGTFAYIASMAVREQDRRTGVASALLYAAEKVAGERWMQRYAVLDVYSDNKPAVNLYQARGYVSSSSDPGWVKFAGRRQRLHMLKQLPVQFDD